jgi:hypothetical protein
VLAQAVMGSAAAIDPTRICRAASDSSESSARAVDKITALGEMTRGIAHDFRNLLCMLNSGLNIAEANTGDPANHDDAVVLRNILLGRSEQ